MCYCEPNEPVGLSPNLWLDAPRDVSGDDSILALMFAYAKLLPAQHA